MQKENARGLLQKMLGPRTEFREGQWEAIDLVANQRRRVLVVQRTGWGKSIVYFVAARILREAGFGPVLLVSPLLSLMRNQILAAEKLGIRAATIHSENLGEWPQVSQALQAGAVDVLMVAPERLGNPEFVEDLLPLLQGRLGLFVVDEAHCISDWGHDFRPDYRRIVGILGRLPAKIPVLCTTATANDRVVKDIETQIPNLHVLRGPLVRTSLRLYTIKQPDQAERLAWLAHFLPQLPGNGIVYTLTVQDARRVAEWLQRHGIVARAYHADLEANERIEIENRLLKNEVKALVATVALGMGFDKPDLGFVIHFQRPGSVVAYYQQVGRAGRAVDSAFGILLSGTEDDEIQEYFIGSAFPPATVMQGVLATLEKAGPLNIDQIGTELNCRRGTIEKALKLLEVDGAVRRDRTGYSRTANPWKPDLERSERVTALRRAELEQIRRYVDHPGCLMEFLAKALDDPAAARCGKCMNCAGKTQRREPPPDLVQAAIDYLRGDLLILEARVRWPKPVLEELSRDLPQAVATSAGEVLRTNIPADFMAEEGRVLCIWGDAGWGAEVARGKYEMGNFSEALVTAAARQVRESWKPQPAPEWVTIVPSLHRPELMRRFGQRLAAELHLPFVEILRKSREAKPQKEMQNSVQQVRNLLGTFEVTASPRKGPVLLLDDVVDSGWTLTLLAVLLRAKGSGPVFPLALAKASPRGS